jgi:Domain of unknown function (DUF6285)
VNLQDRPTAAELLDAVAGFLDELGPDLDAGRRFHARVAANVCRILIRELALGPAHEVRQHELLAGLLGRDGEPAELWAGLAAAIRSGALDGRRDEVVAVLREVTAQKLAIDNPGYTEAERWTTD